MNVYYIEYMESVKFFYNDNALEIEKGSKLIKFLRACFRKYGEMIKFKELI